MVENEIKRTIEKKAIELGLKWCAKTEEILFHAHHYKPDDDYMDLTLDFKAYKEKSEKFFSNSNTLMMLVRISKGL